MQKYMKQLAALILMLSVFVLLALFTMLFNPQDRLDVKQFISMLPTAFYQFTHFYEYQYVVPKSQILRDLFPFIFKPWLNTTLILMLSILIAIVASIFWIIVGHLIKPVQKIIRRVIKIIGYLPDVFIVSVMIIFVIWFYKKTNILLVEVASAFENDIVLFPAVVLSIFPFIQFYKILDSSIEDEMGKPYVTLAQSKGLTSFEVLTRHIIPNTLPVFYINFRQVVWMTLSSLLVMELIFNIFGVTSFLYSYRDPVIILVVFMLMTIPIALLFKVLQWAVTLRTGVKL